MPATASIINPFPGLRPFEENESYLFFGREKQIGELLGTLQETHLLAIVGSSGSGKSSLVKCGLVPSLQKGLIPEADSNWDVAFFTPGNTPFQNMAKTLSSVFDTPKDEEGREYSEKVTEAALRRNDNGLIDFCKEKSSKNSLLLVIDQFEEIFRYRKQEIQNEESEQNTAAFVDLLLKTAQLKNPSTYIVLTMRSDYLGDCTLFEGLPEAINEGQYLIPRMTRDERRKAIAGPIEVSGATASPEFINRLLSDVGNNPDQLPILQHSLMRTWNYWNEHETPNVPLDVKHYEAIGTMSKALSRHAEEAYSELKTDRQKRICELMFKALTEKGADNKGVRRPLPLYQICALTDASEKEVKEVVDVFRKPGRTFLMPSNIVDLEKNTVIDIAHESLMRVWSRLISWVNDEKQSAETYLRLAEAAALYQQSQSGLWRDPELQVALRWQELNQPNEAWAARYNPSFERGISFLEYSHKQHEFEKEEKERRQLVRLKRTRIIAIVVSIAAILALILATYAIFQRTEADKQKNLANKEKRKAEANAEEAIKQKGFADIEREKAEKHADEAIKQKNIATEQRTEAIRQKEEAVRQEKEAYRQRTIAQEQKELANSLRLLAVASEAEAITQKDKAVKNEKEAREQRQNALRQEKIALENAKKANRLKNLALARNRSLEAIQVINDGGVKEGVEEALAAYELNKEYNGPRQNNDNYEALNKGLTTLQPDAYLHENGSSLKALAVKNSQIVVANEKGNISILKKWDDVLQPQITIQLKNAQLLSVNYSDNNKYLAAGSYEGYLAIWNNNGLTMKSQPIFNKSIDGQPILNILPASNSAFIIQTKNKVYIKKVKNKLLQSIGTLSYFNIKDIQITKDRAFLLVATKSKIIIHSLNKDLSFGEEQTITLKKPITKVAISEDNKYLAAGFEDGQVAIIELDGSQKVISTGYELMHQTQISGLAFYQFDDFLQLASSSYDNTAQLFDVTNRNRTDLQEDKITLRGHQKWTYGIQYSDDGKYVYTINEDKTIRAWHTNSSEMVEILKKAINE
jgi:energy-coupling factor transporter ATP-binding protein EcfA2